LEEEGNMKAMSRGKRMRAAFAGTGGADTFSRILELRTSYGNQKEEE
jgi:hypothetical protein